MRARFVVPWLCAACASSPGEDPGAGGAGGPCSTAVERCNGLDDDCDGGVDEDQPELTCGTGACTFAAPSCGSGALLTCPAPPRRDACGNGSDDDCDGAADCGDADCGGTHVVVSDADHVGAGAAAPLPGGGWLVAAQVGTSVRVIRVGPTGDPEDSEDAGPGSRPELAPLGGSRFALLFTGPAGAVLRAIEPEPLAIAGLDGPPSPEGTVGSALHPVPGGGVVATIVRPAPTLGAAVGWYDADGALQGTWLDGPADRVAFAVAVPVADGQLVLLTLVNSDRGGRNLQVETLDPGTRKLGEPHVIGIGAFTSLRAVALPGGGAMAAIAATDTQGPRIEVVQVAPDGKVLERRRAEGAVSNGFPPLLALDGDGLVLGGSVDRGRVSYWPVPVPLAALGAPVDLPEPGAGLLLVERAGAGARAIVVDPSSPPEVLYRSTEFCP